LTINKIKMQCFEPSLSPYSLVPIERKNMVAVRGYQPIQEKLKTILVITQ